MPENTIQDTTNDEIDLIDCLRVLIKHKWLILLGTIVPTLIVGLILHRLPGNSKISYSYRMAMSEIDLRVLEDKFYGQQNLEHLTKEFRTKGLPKDLTSNALRKIVTFEIQPTLFDTKARTFDELIKRQGAKGTLLVMHIVENPKTLSEAASVYRENFEKIIPLYLEKIPLVEKIAGYKREMAGFEEGRYTLTLQMNQKKLTLDKLKKTGTENSENLPGGVIFQLNSVKGNSEYLPIAYQIQAIQTQIITMEEDLRTKQEQHDYYTGLLKCSETLLDRLDNMVRNGSTLQLFHQFLTDTLAKSDQNVPYLQDYLKAYIKYIENSMAITAPLTDNPTVYMVPKGTLKKTTLVFVVTLIFSVLGVFLQDGLRRRVSAE